MQQDCGAGMHSDDDLELEPAQGIDPITESSSKGPTEPGSEPHTINENINDVWLRHHRAQADNRTSYSVTELLIATGIAAVIMSVARAFPSGQSAGILGLLVVLGFIASAFGLLSRLAHLSVWVLLLLYVMMSIVAIVSD